MAKKKNTKKPFSERQKSSLILGSIGLVVFLITGFQFSSGVGVLESSNMFRQSRIVSVDPYSFEVKTNYAGIIGLAIAVGGAVGFFVYKDDQ